jgi:hypothetical protein
MVETYIFISFHKIIFQQKLVGWEILQTFKRDDIFISFHKIIFQQKLVGWEILQTFKRDGLL